MPLHQGKQQRLLVRKIAVQCAGLDAHGRRQLAPAVQAHHWLRCRRSTGPGVPVKTIDPGTGRSPLARELGKTWYVRLPDAECAPGEAFARERRAFWTLRREVWDSVLVGDAPFVERTPPGQPPRFVRMQEIEDEYLGRDLTDPSIRSAARARILKVIEEYRAR